ncbi:phytanoyl-CoA dioxygenase family protein [Pseudorhodoplanes sp.]|uniref:phytanoyl-CoA dioxygenase family protein n=1 Tax=Pseudorhodoplanes sp. TaxID=1934341 RepID=UPI003D10C205
MTASGLRKLTAAAKTPLYAFSILTGAKSFIGNPVLGSRRLNEIGLHAARVRMAERLGRYRRNLLAARLDAADRTALLRDGFVVKSDFLPVPEFERLRTEVFGRAWDLREMRQGHTVTRRVFLDAASLRKDNPALGRFITSPEVAALLRFAGATGGQPVTSIQCILANQGVGADDPQCAIHADTFHSTSKAWFFLHDVGPDDGPFFYVPGSNVLTPRRLEWERAQSLAASSHAMRDHAEGSFRISNDDLRALGLPQPLPVTVRANTLVVADTFGFHGRTPSPAATRRVELYATLRRNPFLPWTGLDPLAFPVVKERMGSFLTTLDRFGIAPMPWKPVGQMRIDAPPQI